MAFKKRGYRKKKSVAWYNKKYSTYDIAKKALKSAMALRRLVNVEIKKYDTYSAVANISTTGSIWPLHDMQQGDTSSQRNGLSIKPLSLLIKMQVFNNSTAGTTVTRVLLIKDLQQVADTNPSVSDILDTTLVNAAYAPLNDLTVGRYKVIRDLKVTLDVARSNRKDVNLYEKLFGHIRYNGSASTDIQKSGYYLVVVSDQATNYPSISWNSRLSFADN